MLRVKSIAPIDRIAQIQRRLRWFAIGAPLALSAMVAFDGLSWTDIAVVGFVAVILWLFVVIAGFAYGAIERASPRQE